MYVQPTQCCAAVFEQPELTCRWCRVQSGSVKLSDSVIAHNMAAFGGAAYVALGGALTFQRCGVRDNSAGTDGGVVYSYAGRSTFSHSTVSNNVATGSGGVASLLQTGELVVDACTVQSNKATNGGVVVANNDAVVSARRSIVRGNSVSHCGGFAEFLVSTPRLNFHTLLYSLTWWCRALRRGASILWTLLNTWRDKEACCALGSGALWLCFVAWPVRIRRKIVAALHLWTALPQPSAAARRCSTSRVWCFKIIPLRPKEVCFLRPGPLLTQPGSPSPPARSLAIGQVQP